MQIRTLHWKGEMPNVQAGFIKGIIVDVHKTIQKVSICLIGYRKPFMSAMTM